MKGLVMEFNPSEDTHFLFKFQDEYNEYDDDASCPMVVEEEFPIDEINPSASDQMDSLSSNPSNAVVKVNFCTMSDDDAIKEMLINGMKCEAVSMTCNRSFFYHFSSSI